MKMTDLLSKLQIETLRSLHDSQSDYATIRNAEGKHICRACDREITFERSANGDGLMVSHGHSGSCPVEYNLFHLRILFLR